MNLSPDELKFVVEASLQMTTWALALGGGSVLALASGSYHRPAKLRWRLSYLLFIPGWLFLAVSIYSGKRITGAYLAARLGKPENVSQIAININSFYLSQQNYLLGALAFFALWLFVYVLIWIFFDMAANQDLTK